MGGIAAAVAVLVTIYANALAIGPTSIALTAAGALASGLVATVAAGLSAFAVAQTVRRTRGVSSDRPPSIEDRLEQAANAMQDAAEVVSEVERELRERHVRLEALALAHKEAQALARVDQETAAAIRTELASVVRREGRRSFWSNIATSALIGFVVGVAAGVVSILIAHQWFS